MIVSLRLGVNDLEFAGSRHLMVAHALMAWLLLLALLAGCDDDAGPIALPPVVPTSTATPSTESVQVEETADAVHIRSAIATLRVNKATLNLYLEAADGTGLAESDLGPRLLADSVDEPTPVTVLGGVRSVQLIARNGAVRGAELTSDDAVLSIEFLTPRTVATRIRPAHPDAVSRVQTSLLAAADEHFYGLTERIVDARTADPRDRRVSEIAPQAVGGLDRRGEAITMVVTPTMALYTPFFHSSRGYGVYVEGTMPGRYDLAQTNPGTVTIDFEFNQRTGEHGVIYFVGDYDTILDEYTALTGRPYLPPRWGFRHLRWRDEHHLGAPAQLDGADMNAELVDDVRMYEALGIPAGNYEFDRPWTSGSTDRGQPGFTSVTFDTNRFPNSDAMLASLQRRGYHVLVFGAPWALGDNAVDAEQFGYYAPRNDILIDYTNPAAVDWWTARVQTLIDRGISGMKLDRAELQATTTELTDVPDRATDIWADGRNGRELKNDYAVLYARVHHDAFAARLGRDFFNYLRAGYAGSQRYGIFWGGDTPGTSNFGLGVPTDLGLRSAILSLARVAFMGFPIWGTDTGGYYEFGDREVFARWLEFSALCPLMEIGGGGNHAPWNMPKDPVYDPELIDIYRRYVTVHHELVPLLYSLALDAHATGRPLARPLVFDFPTDPAVADLWDEFLLGHDLLVAPVWQSGARSRQVYLPAGAWIDYWDPAQRYTGPTTITAEAALDRLPLYVRAGGVLPLAVSTAVTGNGSAASAGRLTLDAYPAETTPTSFVLHEDEGDSTFTLSETGCQGTPCVRLGISPSHRGYVVRLLSMAPEGVTLDGEPLPQLDSFAAFEAVETGWYYDVSLSRLWSKFATHGAGARLEATR
jgi:alpha-D-xyloside xylohydrolase